MLLQLLQRNIRQNHPPRRPQNHRGCHPRLVRLLPTSGAYAPAISRLQSRKTVLWPRRGKIVSPLRAEPQKDLRHLRAYRMTPHIPFRRFTTPAPQKARQRIETARYQRATQNIRSRTIITRFHVIIKKSGPIPCQEKLHEISPYHSPLAMNQPRYESRTFPTPYSGREKTIGEAPSRQ